MAVGTVSRFDLVQAEKAIRGIAVTTPVIGSSALSRFAGEVPVALKLENLQVTGSFKVRGAANRIKGLTQPERRRGIVTCSSGNHGRATRDAGRSVAGGGLRDRRRVREPEFQGAPRAPGL